MKASALWLPSALILAVACAKSGQGGSPPDGAPDTGDASAAGDDGGNPTPGGTLQCTQPSLGSPLLRLLTRSEFDRTISGTASEPTSGVFPQIAGQWTDSLPADSVSTAGFDNDSSATVGNQQASALLDTALSVATAVIGSALPTLLPCASSSADRTCAEQFVMQYGRRLFRRPLTTPEHDRYMAFYDSAITKSDFKTALKWMTVGLIQSPNAIYRSEIGTDNGNGKRTLSPYEVATEIAYTYTGSTPSDDLLTKAGSGALGDPVALAKSLLATADGKEALQQFFDGYLAYTTVTSMQKANIPNFGSYSVDMVSETRAFIDTVVFQQHGGLKELLTAATTNPSKNLAQYYQFPLPSADYASIQRPSGQGIGILAQGAFLASHANAQASSPTQRGLFPYLRLLCHTKPQVPNTVPALGAPQPGTYTTRQRYELLHAHDPSCAGCHKLWDPIGFGFEHFDEGGKYRVTESGLTIDSSGAVPDPTQPHSEADGGFDYTPIFTFADEEGLVTGLANQPVSYQCFAAYLATYAYGTAESCLGASQVAALQSGSIGIVDAFAALAGELHFTQRSSH